MCRLLINHAHGRKAEKRDGNALKVTFDESRAAADDSELVDVWYWPSAVPHIADFEGD